MVNAEDIKHWIEEGLAASQVSVTGDGRHFQAIVISEKFAGKSLMERHRMVYQSLGDRMAEQIHALSLKTITPDEQA